MRLSQSAPFRQAMNLFAQNLLRSGRPSTTFVPTREMSDAACGVIGELHTIGLKRGGTPTVFINAEVIKAIGNRVQNLPVSDGLDRLDIFRSPADVNRKLENHSANVASGTPAKLRLAEMYDQMTGAPIKPASPSYADIALTESIGNLSSGAEALLVGIHPSVLRDEGLSGKQIDLVDTSPDVVAKYREVLEDAGFRLNTDTGCHEKDFGDGKGMTSVAVIEGDINALLKENDCRYDFVGDANAATIYGKNKDIVNAYFEHLKDGGKAQFSVCDKFDVAQHPGAVSIDDLAKHEDKNPTVIGATYSFRTTDDKGKSTNVFTERKFEYENQDDKKKTIEALKNDTGKSGGLGRFYVTMEK